MEALASFVEPLFSKADECMVDTTAAQLSYVFKHDKKFQNLRGKVEELKCVRQKMQQSVDKAKRSGEKFLMILKVSYRPALEGISIRPVKEYEAFGSRSDAFNGAMAALEDDNVNTPNMVNIQDKIAEKLGLKIEERSVDVRAARLHDRLKKIINVLIILDDIWVTLDLEALGIPSIDDHKGCKILMTSRRQEVLKSMGSQKVLPIELLKEDEA
ncbi:hypothetical protein Goshw_019370 [Gossypium schwendimanii]|uniref:NB-ARC domain-containing protein n=1 Tax=Gossypium schwendimanii TaxID=34291 RepID=A0A7J9NAY4_GOSSC|nr:hypothetical protein [Gossypium schwendimanii]